jgi:hypothetical protein
MLYNPIRQKFICTLGILAKHQFWFETNLELTRLELMFLLLTSKGIIPQLAYYNLHVNNFTIISQEQCCILK